MDKTFENVLKFLEQEQKIKDANLKFIFNLELDSDLVRVAMAAATDDFALTMKKLKEEFDVS